MKHECTGEAHTHTPTHTPWWIQLPVYFSGAQPEEKREEEEKVSELRDSKSTFSFSHCDAQHARLVAMMSP